MSNSMSSQYVHQVLAALIESVATRVMSLAIACKAGSLCKQLGGLALFQFYLFTSRAIRPLHPRIMDL